MFTDAELETIVILCQRQVDVSAFRRVSPEYLERVQGVEAKASKELQHRGEVQHNQQLLDK